MFDINDQPQIWIAKDAVLPDVCVGCGMYTDRRIVKKFVEKVETPVIAESAPDATGLGCLLMLLGPVGMLISLFLNMRNNSSKGESKTKFKTITLKAKVKIPVCPLCDSEDKAKPVDANFAQQALAFTSNNNFIRQYDELNDPI
jgi:hypothetical protein